MGNRRYAAAGVVLLGLIFVAVFAEQLTPREYDIGRVQDRLQAPSAEHPLGTDHAGRGLLARMTAAPYSATMATVRQFNTAGPVVAADHYHIPPLERIDLDTVLQHHTMGR